MEIQVLYFAVFRERLGRDEESLELAAGSTVSQALDALGERHEAIAGLRGRFQTAVNQTMVGGEHALCDGDELALIPPVAGGSDGRHIRVLDEPLSLDRCVRAVSGAGMGGIVCFVGMVREQSRGVTVVRLEYEAYAAMAEKVFHEIADELVTEVPGVALAVEHRTGTLAIGDWAVVIAAAAPHRAEAFTACRAMIDRLKDRAPIWKKEFDAAGGEWVGLGP